MWSGQDIWLSSIIVLQWHLVAQHTTKCHCWCVVRICCVRSCESILDKIHGKHSFLFDNKREDTQILLFDMTT